MNENDLRNQLGDKSSPPSPSSCPLFSLFSPFSLPNPDAIIKTQPLAFFFLLYLNSPSVIFIRRLRLTGVKTAEAEFFTSSSSIAG